jgi:hypothetical protein
VKWVLVILLAIRAAFPLGLPAASTSACESLAESVSCPCCDPDACPCATSDDEAPVPAPALPTPSPRVDLSTLIHFVAPAPTLMSCAWADSLAAADPGEAALACPHPTLNARAQAALCIWRT